MTFGIDELFLPFQNPNAHKKSLELVGQTAVGIFFGMNEKHIKINMKL